MVMLAEHYDFVIGGDPDRDTIDLAVLDTGAGRVHAHVADAANGAGYRRMLDWAREHAAGTAGMGAGGNRQLRRRLGRVSRRGR